MASTAANSSSISALSTSVDSRFALINGNSTSNGVTVGSGAVTTGISDTAVGVNAKATSNMGSAFGYNAQALGNNSTALGANSFAAGPSDTAVGANAHVGNFVETKNARLAAGAKANHLSYLGDTSIGAKTNIGAGTITCNYDGYGKFETVIGADALLEDARTSIAGRRQKIETLAELIALARDGHPTCQRVLTEAATTLGEAIGNLCNVLNPEVVVLGGAFGRQDAADYTLGPCREALSRSGLQAAVEGSRGTANHKDPDDKQLRVEASTLEHAAAHGALILALRGTEYDSPK